MSAWLPWIEFACLLAFPFVAMSLIALAQQHGWLLPRCPECRARMNVETKTLREPTATEPGAGLSIRTCPNCNYRVERRFPIDKYMGNTRGQNPLFVLRWKRELWRSITKETIERSERDSAQRKRR